MKKITSPSSPELKEVAKLSTIKGRKVFKKFIAEGVRAIATLITSPIELVNLYATDDELEQALLLAPEYKIINVSEKVLDKISAAKTPNGLLGVFKIPEAPSIAELKPGLVLAQVSDPGNMGTLIRTSVACNLKSIVIVEGTDPWGPKVVQSSAGAIGLIKIFRWDWDTLMKNRKDLQLCSLVVKDGADINSIDPEKALLIIGNEAHGIPYDWQKQTDQSVTLPMPGDTESLNAGVAGSIALYLTFCKK